MAELKWVRYSDLGKIGEQALWEDPTITPGAVDGLTPKIWEPEEILLELLEAGMLK